MQNEDFLSHDHDDNDNNNDATAINNNNDNYADNDNDDHNNLNRKQTGPMTIADTISFSILSNSIYKTHKVAGAGL